MKMMTVGCGHSFAAGLRGSLRREGCFEDVEVWEYTPGPNGSPNGKGRERSAQEAAQDLDVVIVRTRDTSVNKPGLLEKLLRTSKCKKVALISEELARDDKRLFELIRTGAAAYLVEEQCSEADLVRTISHVGSGEYPAADAVLSRPGIALRVLESFEEGAGDDASSISLTPPEARLLKVIAEGAARELAASKLGITLRTMNKSAGRVLEKLVARDTARWEATRNALLSLQLARDGNLLIFGPTPFGDGPQQAAVGRSRK